MSELGEDVASSSSSATIFIPANAAEWNELLEGTGIEHPTSTWGFLQESTETMTDSIGTVTYQQSVTGWTRKDR